jgi:GNAT superfamily N-acetyltransferase
MSGYPVMVQLRPHLSEDEFYDHVSEQMRDGYQLVYLASDAGTVTVAGFRFSNTLAWGKILYVDDLVTSKNQRSQGHGEEMLEWLIEYARKNGCAELHLDSGIKRYEAHRFYLGYGMDITCHHFAFKLKGVDQ